MGTILVTISTHSEQSVGPLAEPASVSAPGWPHHQQQAHSTADVWLVVWLGPLIGFFCSERLLKSEPGFSLSLGMNHFFWAWKGDGGTGGCMP